MSLVRTESFDGIAVLTLDRPRANAFDADLVEDLRAAIRECASARARAVVLASSQKIFSGGWDLPTLISFDRRAMAEFVEAYTGLIREVFGFPAPVVAALPGHAIAGGFILAMAADERIAAEGESLFGLSEVALGVPLPRAFFEIFRQQLGKRAAERLAATAENVPLARALASGLVDRIVPAPDLLAAAIERARALGAPLPSATAEVRRWSRAEALARFDDASEGDPFLDFWFAPDARERIGALVDRLTKKR
jgi:enoyl-CoA hydratase